MTFNPCPKPPPKEKKKQQPIQRKPMANNSKPLVMSAKPIRKKSAKLAKLERERKTLTNGVCWVSQQTGPHLHPHEIFFGKGKRQLSIKWGMVVDLAPEWHTMSNKGVHFNSELDASLKQWGQQQFEKMFPNEEFIAIFGKNYIIT